MSYEWVIQDYVSSLTPQTCVTKEIAKKGAGNWEKVGHKEFWCIEPPKSFFIEKIRLLLK